MLSQLHVMDLTKKEIIIQNEFETLLPGIKVRSARAGSKSKVSNSLFCILPENSNLRNSQYYYEENVNLIHFTNLEALKSILKSKVLRLYNLNNLNDPREYSFAGDLLTYNRNNRDDAKENMYLLSMCKTDVLTRHPQFEFNMWRLYGDYGNGVAIELSFDNSRLGELKDYYLSQVFYGASSKVKLKEVSKLLHKYRNETPSIEVDLGQIVAFHKSNLYKLESEVRLLFDNRNKKLHSSTTYSNKQVILSPLIKDDFSKSESSNKSIKYLELPIFQNGIEPISTCIPIPKIQRIILGYAYKDMFKRHAKEIESLMNSGLGYEIPVELSRMAKYYYQR